MFCNLATPTPTFISCFRLQEVDHVHFHVIPKPTASDDQGLVIGWPAQKISMDELKALHEELKGKL